jgi:hypothetical protein
MMTHVAKKQYLVSSKILWRVRFFLPKRKILKGKKVKREKLSGDDNGVKPDTPS